MVVTPTHPFRGLCTLWREKLRLAERAKESFTKSAKLACSFYDGTVDPTEALLPTEKHRRLIEANDYQLPTFQISVNKVSELVQIFGPALYYRNPHRMVKPVKRPQIDVLLRAYALLSQMQPGMPPDPMVLQQLASQLSTNDMVEMETMKAKAELQQLVLNYTPRELGLNVEARKAIDECLIKGMGLVMVEVYQFPASSMRLVGSFHYSVDKLLIDPDADCIEDAKWIAMECVHPVWEVEETYGYARGSLKANMMSHHQAAVDRVDPDSAYKQKQGNTSDLIRYWKIWSKMGIGSLLQGAKESQAIGDMLDGLLGRYVYLVVADSHPFFLNCPPEVLERPADEALMQELSQRFAWPIPFWKDDLWPIAPLYFHENPNGLWPISHVEFAIGELIAINWIASFLMSKVAKNSRDFVAILQEADEELKEALESGADMTVLQLKGSMNRNINELIQFLQHPPFNKDIVQVLEFMQDLFEKRTGLSEIQYGQTSRQLRSAQEAALKGDFARIRPDDMSNKVEEWSSRVARMEAAASRLMLTGQDVAPIVGTSFAMLWDRLVATPDPEVAFRELEVTIEAGSAKKPNKQAEVTNMDLAMQTMFNHLMSLASSGIPGPVNALLKDWAKAHDFEVSNYLIPEPQLEALAMMRRQQETGGENKRPPQQGEAP